ncbi:MAG: class A beta-lactamase-related serine hydrolase [Rhodothermia bacterium]|nr:class A beta-lactamase-related serine hydrolase [Rhodothermia bacterium]
MTFTHRGCESESKPAVSAILAISCVVLAFVLFGCATTTSETHHLNRRLEEFISGYPHATIAVSLRDASGGVAIDVNGDSLIHAASTMKVPVLIEIYRQAAEGRFSLDDSVAITNQFTSIYDDSIFSIDVVDDSDKEIYDAVGAKMTIRDLAYRLITSSSNLATNILVDLVSADSIQSTIESLGATRMRVLRGVEDIKAFRAGMNNVATSRDLAVLLESILSGRAVSEKDSQEMIDIMADVPSFRMISAGVPRGTKVAHKTGSIPTRNHRHDAGIVFPTNGEPYVVVILTRDTRSAGEAEEVGKAISTMIYETLRGL